MASPIYDLRAPASINKELIMAIKGYGDSIEDEYRNRYTIGFIGGFLFGFGVAVMGIAVILDRGRMRIPRRLKDFLSSLD